jgi:hypothetical protein
MTHPYFPPGTHYVNIDLSLSIVFELPSGGLPSSCINYTTEVEGTFGTSFTNIRNMDI